MGRVIVADANVVIAAANANHVHHSAAQQLLREHGLEGVVLHSLTLAEVLVGPAKLGEQGAARRALARAGFDLSPTGDPAPEALARVRATASLTMPDACVLATAEHLQADLATFDKRLAREARASAVTVLGLR